MRSLFLYRQVVPETSQPFRFLETVMTADGPRTRVVDGVYATIDEAIAGMADRLGLPEDKE